MTERYSGIDNLESMRHARRYNAFLLVAIAEASSGAHRVVDFGAGDGTFARAMRDRGLDVSCVETDPGLRYDLETDATNPDFKHPLVGDRGIDTDNIQPRIGVSWNPYGEGRTVIRGGV